MARSPGRVRRRATCGRAWAGWGGRGAGRDVVDLGFGNPDLPSPGIAVEKLAEAAHNTRNHRYSASRGIPKLRQALADHYRRSFGVELDPDTEVISTIGAKEGSGKAAIVPTPSYPIHISGSYFAGADARQVPIGDGTDGAGHLDRVMEAWEPGWPKPRVVVLSFPHNPTTTTVELAGLQCRTGTWARSSSRRTWCASATWRSRPVWAAARVGSEPAGAPGLSRAQRARSQSPTETLARPALVRAGLTVAPAVKISGVGWVDLLVEGRIVVELDGFAYHSGRVEYREDRRRDRELVRQGYLVLRFTFEDVMRDPEIVVRAVLAVLANPHSRSSGT